MSLAEEHIRTFKASLDELPYDFIAMTPREIAVINLSRHAVKLVQGFNRTILFTTGQTTVEIAERLTLEHVLANDTHTAQHFVAVGTSVEQQEKELYVFSLTDGVGTHTVGTKETDFNLGLDPDRRRTLLSIIRATT